MKNFASYIPIKSKFEILCKGIRNPKKIPPYLQSLTSPYLSYALTPVVTNKIGVNVLTTKQLQCRNKKNNISIWYYSNNKKNYHYAPRKPSTIPEEIKKEVGWHTYQQPYVTVLSDSWIIGPESLVMTPNGEYILDVASGRWKMISRGISSAITSGINPFRSRGCPKNYTYSNAALLTGPLSEAFAHWFLDYLPRLHGIEKYSDNIEENTKIIIDSNPPSWMVESLYLLGYDDEDLINISEEISSVKNLIIPSTGQDSEVPYRESRHPPSYNYKYTQKVKNNVESDIELDYPKRLFISRQDANSRRVVNRDILQEILEDYNFKSVTLSQMSLSDQVSLFSQANLIMSPHGAGLANIMFCEKNTPVIELFGTHVTTAYYNLANTMGVKYYCLKCRGCKDDILIDENKIREMIETVIFNQSE